MGAPRSPTGGPATTDPPKPSPPEKPLPGDCCDGGCDPCVQDIYAEELEAYEQDLRRWEERSGRGGAAGGEAANG